MDETNQQAAVTPAVDSAPTQTPNESVNTPPVENTGSESNSAPSNVPYSRFKEVIDVKNQFESQIEELQNRLSAHEGNLAQKAKGNVVDKYVQKMVQAGMDPNVAALIAETQLQAAQDIVGERLAPLEQESAATRVDQWVNKLSQTHKDWYELEPDMEKVLDTMPKHMQRAFMSSPEGLDALYAKAKLKKMEATQQQAFNQGANAAYQNKGLKGAVSSTPGASVPKPTALTREQIMALSESEFRSRYQEIIGNR